MIDNIPGKERIRDEVSAAYMQQAMITAGLTVGGLMNFTIDHDDDRPACTVHRTIQHMRNGTSCVSGETRTLLTVLALHPEFPR